MPALVVRIPGMLAEIGDGRREIPVEAATVRAAIEALLEVLPQLKVHLLDESGDLRRHVSCFHNGRIVTGKERWQAPTAEGDVVTVLQAVSGGASGRPVVHSPPALWESGLGGIAAPGNLGRPCR